MSVLKHPVGVNRNSPSGEKHNRRKKFGTVSSMKMEWLIWAFTLGEVAGALASAASVVLSLFGFSSVLASFFGVSSAATVAGDVMLAVLVAAALVLLGGSAFVSVVFVSVGLSASVVGVWVTSPSVDGVLVVAASAAVGVGSSGLVSSDLFWDADLSSASALFVLSAVSGFVVDAESLPTAALAVELALFAFINMMAIKKTGRSLFRPWAAVFSSDPIYLYMFILTLTHVMNDIYIAQVNLDALKL